MCASTEIRHRMVRRLGGNDGGGDEDEDGNIVRWCTIGRDYERDCESMPVLFPGFKRLDKCLLERKRVMVSVNILNIEGKRNPPKGISVIRARVTIALLYLQKKKDERALARVRNTTEARFYV